MSISSYRQLKVWQLAMELAELIYQLTESLPPQETYGLSGQLRRAGVSVPSNIAEGHAQDSTRSYLRHLSISRGSLAEIETQLLLCARLKFLPKQNADAALSLTDGLGRMLRNLQTSLQRKLKNRRPPNP